MHRSVWGRKPALFFIFGLLLFSLTLQAQEGPVIVHKGLDCMVTNKHATIRALVEPSTNIRVVRIYFRSVLYSTYYFVEMTQDGEEFQAVLPRPKPETPRVVYYIEAVTNDFDTARTPNYEPEVRAEGECDVDDVVPGYFPGDPNIIIGITQAGIPAIPPGFEALGLAGGGISRTTGILIGGAAAGVATGIILAGGGPEDTTTTPTTTTAPGTTTTPTTTTTSAPAGSGPVACFSTNPAPPRIKVNETVRFDASCSTPTSSQPTGIGSGWAQTAGITKYEWDFGDGRAGREGRAVQRTYFETGTFTATLTVTNQAGLQDQATRNVVVEGETATTTTAPPTTTTAPPTTSTTSTTSTTTTTSIPNEANLTLSLSRSPASVPVGGTVTFTITITNTGPLDATTVSLNNSISGHNPGVPFTVSAFVCSINTPAGTVNCTWPSIPAGGSETVNITVTALSNPLSLTANVGLGAPPCCLPANNGASISAGVTLRTGDTQQAIEAFFVSALEAPPPDGRLKGQVSINGQKTDNTDNSSPFRHPYSGPAGENVVEAYLVAGDTEEGRWRFDFRQAANFVRGSIRVDSGQVVSVGPQEVVFRVTGTSSPRIRFRYRLKR